MENDKSIPGGNQSGNNMYSYQEEQKVPVVEADAIRRSLGEGNPNAIQDYQINNNYAINQERVINQNSQLIQPGQNPPLYWMFFVIFGIIQIVIIILLANYYEWDDFNAPKNINNEELKDENTIKQIENKYKLFQEINIIIFLGFGLLRSFLKHHSWTSIALTFIGGVLSFEFGLFTLICWGGVFKKEWNNGKFNYQHLLDSNYCSAANIISLGAILGKISLTQYLFIIIFETIFSTFNYVLLRQQLRIIDIGGALTVHLFGSVFGAIFSIILFLTKNEREKIKYSPHFGSSYNSNILAIFGTLILISYWPSFNTALIEKSEYKFLGIINTYLAILGSIVGTFCISPIYNSGKIKIKDILNSCFTGAIIISGCCHIINHLWISILLGAICGGLITYLCNFFSDKLKKEGFYDTSDVIYYHGIPAFFGGIVTTIVVGTFENKNEKVKKKDLYEYIGTIMNYTDFGGPEKEIDISNYAAIHFAGIFISIIIALVSGFVSGFAIRFSNCRNLNIYFNDSEFFDINDNEHEPFPWEDEQIQLQQNYISRDGP